MLKKPIFMSGLRKSGTSMVKDLIDGHPEIFVYPPNEFHFFRFSSHPSLVKDKKAWESELDKIKEHLISTHFVNDINKHDYGEIVNVLKFKEKVMGAQVKTYAELIEAVSKAMAESCYEFKGDVNDIRFASKTVLETEFFLELKKWFPDLKFIYILRNPYGHFNAIRFSMRSKTKVSPEKMDFNWWRNPYPFLGGEIKRMKISYYFMKKYSSLYPENFYILVYDRVLLNPEEEMRNLADFIEVPFHECMLNTLVCGKLGVRPGWSIDKHTTEIDSRPVTAWKEQISDLEIKLVNRYFRDIITEFNFMSASSNALIWKPFHISERPITYLQNRGLFWSKAINMWK